MSLERERREHFDSSDSIRPDLKGDTNKKKLGVFQDETNSLLITEFIALNPKVYSLKYQTIDEFNKIKIAKTLA